MNIKNISTQRLLNLFRNLRKFLYLSKYDESFIENDSYDYGQDYYMLDSMKKELDTREHIPRKREIARKQKKNLKYKR